MRNILLLLTFFMVVFPLVTTTAQERTITGTVTSIDDGMPLPGVNVRVEGTSDGTVTDMDGQYALAASQGTVLIFSMVGFVTQEITLGTQDVVNVQLQTDLQ